MKSIVVAATIGLFATSAHAQCYTGEGCGITHDGWYATQFYMLCSSPSEAYCSNLATGGGAYVRMVYDFPVGSEAACQFVLRRAQAQTGLPYGSCIDYTTP
jgi:hypothetical protein